MTRFQERYQYSESTGGTSIMNWTKSKGKVEFYKPPKNGEGAIDIVPYIIKTDKHPLVRKKKLKIGDLDYVLDVWVHRQIGPNNQDCLCLRANYNEKCPICEFVQDRLKQFGKTDSQYINLKAKRRCFYNVLDATTESNTIHIFDVSHFLFEKEVQDEAKVVGQKKGLNILDYADPEQGFTISYRTTTEKSGGFDTTKFKRIDFEKRPSDLISKKMMERALSLDEYLITSTYKELEELLYGMNEEENTEFVGGENVHDSDNVEEKSTTRRKQVVEESESEEQPTRRTRNTSKNEDDVSKEEKPKRKMVEEEPEEEEEEKPRRKVVEEEPVEKETHRSRKDPSDEPKQEESMEPDLEEEEIEEKPRGSSERKKPELDDSKKTSNAKECPFGHTYGTDHDQFVDCNKCNLWDKCLSASKSK